MNHYEWYSFKRRTKTSQSKKKKKKKSCCLSPLFLLGFISKNWTERCKNVLFLHKYFRMPSELMIPCKTCIISKLQKSHPESAQKRCKQEGKKRVSCARGMSNACSEMTETASKAPDVHYHFKSTSWSFFKRSFPITLMTICVPFSLKFSLHNKSSENIAFCTMRETTL